MSDKMPDWEAMAMDISEAEREHLMCKAREAAFLFRDIEQGRLSDREYQLVLDALFLYMEVHQMKADGMLDEGQLPTGKAFRRPFRSIR